jgi:hypothetical protein
VFFCFCNHALKLSFLITEKNLNSIDIEPVIRIIIIETDICRNYKGGECKYASAEMEVAQWGAGSMTEEVRVFARVLMQLIIVPALGLGLGDWPCMARRGF